MRVLFTHESAVSGRRRAFTIVELLVVIAIIGVLVSILLPAVNAARDSAARTQNLNNLKQIGTAIMSYETSKKTFPPLVKYPRDSRDIRRATSWAFEILPHLEQQNIYDRFDPTKDCDDEVNAIAMATPIGLYANPRIRDSRIDRPFLRGQRGLGTSIDYAANGGVAVDTNQQPLQLPRDPSSAKIETPYQLKFNPKYSGPFHHDLAVPQAAVKDGLGNTVAVGDRWIGPPVPTGDRPWNDLAGLAGASMPTTVRFGNGDDMASASGMGMPFPRAKDDPSIYKFGSIKGNDCCFVFLDGHALWLTYDIEPTVLQRLMSINDGLPIPPLD